MYRSIALAAAGLLPFASATLNKLAVAKNLTYFGTATDNPELTDSAYVAILDDETEWGQITPGNTMKWVYTEPTQGTFNYTEGDVIMDLAEANGQLLRCHNLVWYNELPSWVTSGTWTNATLIAALQNHITNEVTHYKGKCYAWDVVNEAFNDDGSYRSDVFYDTIGEAYIPIAFAAAAAADPDVKLYYNDYNIEYAGTKSTAAQNLVTSLKAQGIKIDGVGLQGHFIVGSTPSLSTQLSNLAAFTALGVEVAYTEVDIRFTSLPPSDSGLQQQATDYVNTVNACLQTDGCVGITVWDFDDAYSWIPSTFSGQGEACLYNSDLSKKPAWTSVVTALGGTVTATATSSSTSSGSSPTTTTVPKWGQCGGLTYTGSTTCVSGTTCTYQNPYYSQCL